MQNLKPNWLTIIAWLMFESVIWATTSITSPDNVIYHLAFFLLNMVFVRRGIAYQANVDKKKVALALSSFWIVALAYASTAMFLAVNLSPDSPYDASAVAVAVWLTRILTTLAAFAFSTTPQGKNNMNKIKEHLESASMVILILLGAFWLIAMLAPIFAALLAVAGMIDPAHAHTKIMFDFYTTYIVPAFAITAIPFVIWFIGFGPGKQER